VSDRFGYRGWYEPEPPFKVGVGIEAKSRRGKIGEKWWSRRFVSLLESFGIGTRLSRGRSYARMGQVMDLDVSPGVVAARVQGSRVTPYRVRIEVDPFSKAEWSRALRAMAERAAFAASLLAGEMPQDIEEAFSAAGVSLFPSSRDDLRTSCSCPDWANPCKHIAATLYILAEAFDEDPFLVLKMRGRDRDQVIGALRALRAQVARSRVRAGVGEGGPGGGGSQAGEADLRADALPLDPGEFWRVGDRFSEVRVDRPQELASPDAFLRGLGPCPASIGGKNAADVLAPVYEMMARRAVELAVGGDGRREGAGEE